MLAGKRGVRVMRHSGCNPFRKLHVSPPSRLLSMCGGYGLRPSPPPIRSPLMRTSGGCPVTGIDFLFLLMVCPTASRRSFPHICHPLRLAQHTGAPDTTHGRPFAGALSCGRAAVRSWCAVYDSSNPDRL